MKHLILALVVFIFFSHIAYASQDDNKPQPIISADLKYLNFNGAINDIEMLLENDKRVPLAMSSDYITKAYHYQGPAKLFFVKAQSKPKSLAESRPQVVNSPKPVVVATVQLPPEGGAFLLLFSGDTTDNLRVIAVPFSTVNVPLASCLAWNLTSRQLGFIYGNQKVLIDPGQRQLMKKPDLANDYFHLQILDQEKGKIRILFGGPYLLENDSRQILFIIDKKRDDPGVALRVVQELPEIKKLSGARNP